MGAPLDERLRSANAAQTTAFRRGAVLLPAPPQVVAIPFEGTTLPGYHFRAAGAGPRPTVVLLGGYDGTVEELYIEALRDYSLACHAERITCPTFVCNAEADDISASAPKLAAALRCPHDLPRPRLRPARRGVVTRPLQIGYFPPQVTVVRSTS